MYSAISSILVLLFAASTALAVPQQQHELATPQVHVDIVGDVEGNAPVVSKAAVDTTWIATWNFEGCDDTGWVRSDFRILNDGNVYWTTNSNYNGIGAISGEAAVLTNHDLCWANPDGYDNDWYQGVCLEYTGDSRILFDYLVDSELGFDFLRVETDSACASFAQVDYDVAPGAGAAGYRDLVWSSSGFDTTTAISDTLALDGYGTGDTHCVYLVFFADGGVASSDTGGIGAVLGAGAVVDNIEILELDGNGNVVGTQAFEDFTGGPGAGTTFVNMQDSTPFGTWSRVFSHITDNDICTENPTCAWLVTDHTTPTLANVQSMAFGPNSYVIRNWLDETVTGPWASLASTPTAVATIVQFRRFPGNFFTTSRAVQNWSIRGRSRVSNTDTPAPGDSIDCVSAWGHVFQWNSLSLFSWITSTYDATGLFPANSADIQVRMRTSDWQWIANASPPVPFEPGPGPYWDRVRLGRQILTGPVMDEGIDARFQGQDAAPNDPAHDSGPGYVQAAGGDIFGTTAFSRSSDLGISATSMNLIVGDSITCNVRDELGHGGLTIEVYASIVAGPHAGKAPPPHSVQASGFFVVTAEQSRFTSGQIVDDLYFLDLHDQYFRGGDVLQYYWWATDAQGGFASNPDGVDGVPSSVAEAEAETGGLFEVNFLPTIVWDQTYLNAIAADDFGDVTPTQQQIDNSSQANCILYYENINSRRRSGDTNRTSFMYTLDKLGYKDAYDVYDHMGLGNTNNHLGSRMSPEQARNYSLIVYDAGIRGPGAPIMPDGNDLDAMKIDMISWFEDWNALSGAPNAEHTLWIMSANAMEERQNASLYTVDMAASFVASDQAQDANPDVFGVSNFVNHVACGQTHVNDQFALSGGCPIIRDYDDITSTGSGVVTHRYGKGSPGTPGAIVMHANAAGFTTILQTFPWFDIAAGTTQNPTQADEELLAKVLTCALPQDCQEPIDPTDTGEDDTIATPARTALHQNRPNPFNPMTTIRFDLARDAHVSLKVYDVAGRLVRTLRNETMPAGFDHQVRWNGLDDRGARVASGVYLYRLVAGDVTATRKLVVMK